MRLTFETRDTHRTLTRLSVLGSLGAVALALIGVPSVDMHGPLHHVGIMDPLCGGTRAAYLLSHGDWTGAWTYNPLVFGLAALAVVGLGRTAIGMTSGKWLAFWLGRRWSVGLLLLAFGLLEVRQQMHAALLMQAWQR